MRFIVLFKIKKELKNGSLNNESLEIDVMTKYKAFLNQEMSDLIEKYNTLKSQVEIDHKKLTDQIQEDRRIMQRQKNWIINASKLFIKNNIDFKPYEDD